MIFIACFFFYVVVEYPVTMSVISIVRNAHFSSSFKLDAVSTRQ